MKFSIKCELDTYATLSYQDSFKFYDYDKDIAYNYPHSSYNYCLDTTDLNLDGDDDEEDELEYDEYHDYSCNEVRVCHYHGEEINVDVDNLEDFIWLEGINEYHHHDDVTQCDACGAWVVKEDATYNSDAEAYFCNDTCEGNYIKEHFYYSEYDDDYFHHEEDITKINVWSDEEQTYKVITISELSLRNLINCRQAFGANQTWFILANAA